MPMVQDGMTANVMTIGSDDTLAHAARLMNTHRIGALPVVDDMRLVGIITESDLFKVLADLLDSEQTA
jgi:CBS domain-containing protein